MCTIYVSSAALWFVASWPTRSSSNEGVLAWLGAMHWAASTSTVIKRLFEVNATYIYLRSKRWVTTSCYYHTLPTLILLTPGVHFLVNPKKDFQLSVHNSSTLVFFSTTPVHCAWVTESMNTRSVDSGRQFGSSVYARDAHNAARAWHFFLSRKVLVKGHV